MEYAKLGNTNIEVSKLCIGCMSFGKAGTMHDWTLDAQESEKVIPHAILHSSESACNLELSQHLLLSQHDCHYNTDDKCKHTYNHKSPWFL